MPRNHRDGRESVGEATASPFAIAAAGGGAEAGPPAGGWTPVAPPEGREWTCAEVRRLLEGDTRSWDRVRGIIERSVPGRDFSTLESDSIRDYTEDLLLADEMRRIRALRDPRTLAAYVRAVTRNRAKFVLMHRARSAAVSLTGRMERSWRRVSDVRSPADGSALADVGPDRRVALAALLLTIRGAVTASQFRLLWIRYVEGLSLRRISKATGTTRQAVARMLDRSLSAVRNRPPARVASPL